MNDLATGAPKGVPDPAPLRSAYKSASATTLRLWLAPHDRRRIAKLADTVATLIDSRPSQTVLLRAGLAALEEQAARVTAEQRKRADGTRGKNEADLKYWIISAARAQGLDRR